MALICRMLLVVGMFLIVVIVTAPLALVNPWVAVVLWVVLIAWIGKKPRPPGSAYGTARWSTAIDLARAGALEPGGLLIGKHPPPKLREAVRYLLKAPAHESLQACRAMFAATQRKEVWVRLKGATHALYTISSGGGKTRGHLIPFLLTNRSSAVVIDPKGEAYQHTHKFRATLGRVVVLDPMKLVTQSPDCFNPLEWVNLDAKALDKLMALAEALVVKDPKAEDGAHWDAAATLFILGMMAFMVSAAPKECVNFRMLCDILADPAKIANASKEMQTMTDQWGGALSRLGFQLDHFVERERGSALTSANRHLTAFNTPAIMDSLSRSTFDPRDLRKGTMTVFLILPMEMVRSKCGVLRLWMSTLLTTCIEEGLQK